MKSNYLNMLKFRKDAKTHFNDSDMIKFIVFGIRTSNGDYKIMNPLKYFTVRSGLESYVNEMSNIGSKVYFIERR